MGEAADREARLAEAERRRTKGFLIGDQMQIAVRLSPDTFRELSMLAALRRQTVARLVRDMIEVQILVERECGDDQAACDLWGPGDVDA